MWNAVCATKAVSIIVRYTIKKGKHFSGQGKAVPTEVGGALPAFDRA